MNYIKHNKEEHSEFRDLMTQIENAEDNKKKDLFQELYIKLHGHHEAEEVTVFPAVKEKLKKEEDMDTVLEMIEEHSLGNYQFSVINRTSVENDTWDAKFSVLKEVLEHHMDEEEKDFSKVAKKVLSEEELETLLDEFEKVNEEKMKEKRESLK